VAMGGIMKKSCKTTSIVRSDDGKIKVTAKVGADQKEEVMDFDYLIIAYPQRKERMEALMTLTPHEKEVFGAVKFMNYNSMLWQFLNETTLADGTKPMTDAQREAALLEANLRKAQARRHNSTYGDLLENEQLEKERQAKEAALISEKKTDATDETKKPTEETTALERQPTVDKHYPTFPTGIVCVVLDKGKIIENLEDGLPTLFFKREDTTAVVSYAVHDDEKYTKEDFEQSSKRTLDRLGYAVLKKPLENNAWEYFPHFECADFCEKNNQLFALQGQKNTFYIGGLLCFENVEKVVEYSHFLVDTFF